MRIRFSTQMLPRVAEYCPSCGFKLLKENVNSSYCPICDIWYHVSNYLGRGSYKEMIKCLEKRKESLNMDRPYTDEYFNTLWEIRCRTCPSTSFKVFKQPRFNIYHSQQYQIVCYSCGNLIETIRIIGESN